ncbi:unnamed protein product [Ranitomeya imitator]|uniref:S5 DRBM domain-containing protein n=1 Tax=Ranitomeya imitator TaxID=111125 RepID=A0ABN9ME15_9NEOB|nr:unnamed protein product [Ranitomeya imitator]
MLDTTSSTTLSFDPEMKSVFNMTAKEGRKRSVSALVAVGNGNGAAGFALGKASDRLIALRKAKNRAVQYLHYIERYNDHTIYHDISSTFKRTTIKMKKQNHGKPGRVYILVPRAMYGCSGRIRKM